MFFSTKFDLVWVEYPPPPSSVEGSHGSNEPNFKNIIISKQLSVIIKYSNI